MAKSINRHFQFLGSSKNVQSGRLWYPAADVYQTEDGWLVKVELAGVSAEDLEIDVQGALQVRHHYPEALTIFILPPDEQALLDRLTDRGRDSPEEINKRFRAARREVHMAKGSGTFDHMVVNDNLEKAVEEVKAIIAGRRGQK